MTKMQRMGTVILTGAALAVPSLVHAQESHEDAVAQTRHHDAKHHTKAKFVGGGAVAGAVVGAKVGGPGGALVGAGAGAVGGVLANKAHRHHEIKEREQGTR